MNDEVEISLKMYANITKTRFFNCTFHENMNRCSNGDRIGALCGKLPFHDTIALVI